MKSCQQLARGLLPAVASGLLASKQNPTGLDSDYIGVRRDAQRLFARRVNDIVDHLVEERLSRDEEADR